MGKFYDAKSGETIEEFAKRIVQHRQGLSCDVIGRFNDVCITVSPYVNERYVVDYYWKNK